jgi:hypothetical protein
MSNSLVSHAELEALRTTLQTQIKSEVSILEQKLLTREITMFFVTVGLTFSATVWIFV